LDRGGSEAVRCWADGDVRFAVGRLLLACGVAGAVGRLSSKVGC
jgi:hypothetical protein